MPHRPLNERLDELARHPRTVSRRAYANRLRTLRGHLARARSEPSPAMALHRANARAVLFQLEGLARADRSVVDRDTFEAVNLRFKTLEDALGAIDFADGVVKRIGDRDDALRTYFMGRRGEACHTLERELTTGEWWSDGGDACDAISGLLDALEDADWPGPHKERRKYAAWYDDTARAIHKRLARGEFDFRKLEAGVHELRRRIRWLSIVPSALEGLFVRDEKAPIATDLRSYATDEIVSSPYNRLPRVEGVGEPLEIDSSAFLAMSWLIQKVGVWKDRAQWTEALVEASCQIGGGPKQAVRRTRSVLGDDFVRTIDVAREVGELATRFARDRVLMRLGSRMQ